MGCDRQILSAPSLPDEGGDLALLYEFQIEVVFDFGVESMKRPDLRPRYLAERLVSAKRISRIQEDLSVAPLEDRRVETGAGAARVLADARHPLPIWEFA